MSSGEVFTHELLHAILHSGLKLNRRLSNQVDTLYRLAYKKLGEDGYKVFLNNPDMDVKDPAHKFEIEAAKERYNYIFRNPTIEKQTINNEYTGIERIQELSNHRDEFITLGLSNQNFIKALTDIKLDGTTYERQSTWSDIKGSNIQQTLMNIAKKIFDFFYNKFSKQTPAENMAKELESLAGELARIDSNEKTKLFETARTLNKVYDNFTDTANSFVQKTFKKLPTPKIAKNLKDLKNAAMEKDTLLSQQMRDMSHSYQKLDQGLIKSIIAEVRGDTKRLAPFVKLLNRRNLFLDTAKQSEAVTWQKQAQDVFKRELTDTEKIAVTKVGFKTDASVLFDSLGSDGVLEILQKPDKLQNQINELLDTIKADESISQYLTYYQRASEALGHFMVHGRARSGEIVFLSTRTIAALKNTESSNTLSEEQIDQAEKYVDQLASIDIYFKKVIQNKFIIPE